MNILSILLNLKLGCHIIKFLHQIKDVRNNLNITTLMQNETKSLFGLKRNKKSVSDCNYFQPNSPVLFNNLSILVKC
jgi:hypothetical protein